MLKSRAPCPEESRQQIVQIVQSPLTVGLSDAFDDESSVERPL